MRCHLCGHDACIWIAATDSWRCACCAYGVQLVRPGELAGVEVKAGTKPKHEQKGLRLKRSR